MALDADPYRTLGLPRGAPLAEVKKAYRRLAKANHPDAAGEAALPRFLAIQAAYDQIAGPESDARRLPGRPSAPGPRRPYEADAERADATRRAYGGRPRPRPGTRPGPRPRPGPRSERPADRPADGPASGERDPAAERRRRKATLGSTSYDDVDPERFDPDWGGASWYGTTSGTYWTLNPKEYADPRKHGPEYQARARRAGVRAPDAEGTENQPSPGSIGTDASADDAPPPPPTHTTSSWWEATRASPGDGRSEPDGSSGARPTQADPGTRRGEAPRRPSVAASVTSGEAAQEISADAVIASVRAWLDDDHPTAAGRIGRAVAGWAPLAIGTGWLIGEVSGCGRFAATCDPSIAPVTWSIQLALLAVLVLVSPLARIATIAGIATLATVFPASILLFATGGEPASMAAARSILGALIMGAWAIGLAYAITREIRRRTRPVS